MEIIVSLHKDWAKCVQSQQKTVKQLDDQGFTIGVRTGMIAASKIEIEKIPIKDSPKFEEKKIIHDYLFKFHTINSIEQGSLLGMKFWVLEGSEFTVKDVKTYELYDHFLGMFKVHPKILKILKEAPEFQ